MKNKNFKENKKMTNTITLNTLKNSCLYDSRETLRNIEELNEALDALRIGNRPMRASEIRDNFEFHRSSIQRTTYLLRCLIHHGYVVRHEKIEGKILITGKSSTKEIDNVVAYYSLA